MRRFEKRMVTIGKVTRNVQMATEKGKVFAQVGTAKVIWDPKRYNLPMIKSIEGNKSALRGQELINARKLIKAFLLAYKELGLKKVEDRAPLANEEVATAEDTGLYGQIGGRDYDGDYVPKELTEEDIFNN